MRRPTPFQIKSALIKILIIKISFCRVGHFNKDQLTEFSFENENQPVCSSGSSCLIANTSTILMSSLSSLIDAIFIVYHVVLSRFTENISVWKKKKNSKSLLSE